MIPLKDTLDVRGGIVATVALLVANVVLFALGSYDAGFWTLLISLLSIWLFGGALEKKVGPVGLIGIYLLAVVLSGLIAGLIEGSAGIFAFFPPGAALGLGLILLALVPSAKIVALIPIPFAMGLYEVPAAIVLAILVVLASITLLLG